MRRGKNLIPCPFSLQEKGQKPHPQPLLLPGEGAFYVVGGDKKRAGEWIKLYICNAGNFSPWIYPAINTEQNKSTIMRIPLSIIALFLLLASFTSDKPVVSENEQLTMAVLYHQKAPEYKALCYQAYNLATVRINQLTKKNTGEKPMAVILDLDETVLDNSPYEAKMVLENIHYPTGWGEWCELAQAEGTPGAVEFIVHARNLGVEVFFITNRKEEVREATKRNLANIGLPGLEDKNLLMRTTTSEKASRRAQVGNTHEIILLVGDNLNDFSDIFEVNKREQRMDKMHFLKKNFGEKFIILPNPMYGDWEQELYPETAKTADQRRDARYRTLRGF
jgi:5'-nucleotidase (lipoprotein e(P4) family)